MTTLQEALDDIAHVLGSTIQPWQRKSLESAHEVLRTALIQQGEPVAYITETEKGDMVWTPDMYSEACTYCDDGEFPVPLYKSAQPVAQPPYVQGG